MAPADPVSTKPLLEKLGVKPGLEVAVLGFRDTAFMEQLPFSKCLVSGTLYNLILLSAEDPEDLRNLRPMQFQVAEKGCLWIVYPKGIQRITQQQVITAGNIGGFTDVKVCSFSATHTGLKFMRRRKP